MAAEMLNEAQMIQLRREISRLQAENNELRVSLRRIVGWLAAFGAGLDKLSEQEHATLAKHGTSLRGTFPTGEKP